MIPFDEETNSLSDPEVESANANSKLHKFNYYGSKLQYNELEHPQSKRNMIYKENSGKFGLTKRISAKRCPSGFIMISDQCIGTEKNHIHFYRSKFIQSFDRQILTNALQAKILAKQSMFA